MKSYVVVGVLRIISDIQRSFYYCLFDIAIVIYIFMIKMHQPVLIFAAIKSKACIRTGGKF